jgi:acyl dehydratase
MGDVTRMEFDTLPSMGGAMRKALFSRKSGLAEGQTIPRIEAVAQGVSADSARVSAFRKVCAYPEGDRLPTTFPHLLATPLHLAMVTSPAFPLRALGVVHVTQKIVQYRPITSGSKLDVSCHIEGHRPAKRGVEFDMVTEIFEGGELVWEAVSTALSMTASKGKSGPRPERPRPAPGSPPNRERSTIWRIPVDMGRRYAKVSGDGNPIHLYKWSAKLFGFKRAIIHGMWSLARCLAELDRHLPEEPVQVDVAFKRPIFMPSSVLFSMQTNEAGIEFDVMTRDGAKPHMSGTAKRPATGP